MKIEDYIKKINDNDLTLNNIDIQGDRNPKPIRCTLSHHPTLGFTITYEDNHEEKHLNNKTLAPLMTAFINNPDVAKKIKYINISNHDLENINLQCLISITFIDFIDSQIKSINLQGLQKLRYLNLSKNKLTNINLKGLNSLLKINLEDNFFTDIDLRGLENSLIELNMKGNPLTNNCIITLLSLSIPVLEIPTLSITLTVETLNSLFKDILTIKNDSKNNYYGIAAELLMKTPITINIMRNITYYCGFTEIKKARATMSGLKTMFSKSCELDKVQTLKNFEANLNVMIKNAKKDYDIVIDDVFSKLEKSFERIENNHKAAREALIFSQTPKNTKNTECGFKSGFINDRKKLGIF